MATTSSSDSSKPAANKLEEMKRKLGQFLREENAFTYPFALAEKYTSAKREYIFLGKPGAGCCSLFASVRD